MLTKLRQLASELQIPRAESFTYKAFRKGHARDLAAHGAKLEEIMQAGEWSSQALKAYLCLNALELQRILMLELDASDDE